jgi:hypothetical protein
MEHLVQQVIEELQDLKTKFDAACNDRKESLKNLCECCEEKAIEVDHAIFGEPILELIEDGVNVIKLNMAFLCNECLEKLKEQKKL